MKARHPLSVVSIHTAADSHWPSETPHTLVILSLTEVLVEVLQNTRLKIIKTIKAIHPLIGWMSIDKSDSSTYLHPGYLTGRT